METEPLAGAGKLRVECPGSFVVLPDFFADDIVLDAVKMPSLATVDLPSENFVLHPTADGDAIAMCVFENRKQDVHVRLNGKGDKRACPRLGDRLRGQEDLGRSAGSAAVAPTSKELQQGIWHTIESRTGQGQDIAARLEDAVPGPVARRFQPGGRPDR